MSIECIGDRVLIIARLRIQQLTLHERVQFVLMQLDPQTAQAIPSASR